VILVSVLFSGVILPTKDCRSDRADWYISPMYYANLVVRALLKAGSSADTWGGRAAALGR
jgi:hypothetical protein